jgi:hypothetical protein
MSGRIVREFLEGSADSLKRSGEEIMSVWWGGFREDGPEERRGARSGRREGRRSRSTRNAVAIVVKSRLFEPSQALGDEALDEGVGEGRVERNASVRPGAVGLARERVAEPGTEGDLGRFRGRFPLCCQRFECTGRLSCC